MVTAERTIHVENVGPNVNVTIPCPEKGGIVVFRGPNDIGKSELTKAVDCCLTGRGKLTSRDGAPGGRVEGYGIRLNVGKARTTRTGELEVESLEGKFDISDMVDPGIKDPTAADARRIKALIQVARADAAPKLFDELIGDNQALIKPDTFETDDLVEMARRVKRDLEGGAQAAETAAEHANAKARALREASAGVDLEQLCDQAALQGELEEALKAQAVIKNRASRADELMIAATAARRELEAAEASYEGLSVEQANAREGEAREDAALAETALRAAEEALRQAQQRHTSACNFVAVCVKDKKAAEAHERNMAGWREAVKQAENIDNPTSKEIADAAVRLEQARAANEAGVLVRKAKQQAAEALEHQQAGGRHTKAAERLRNAARETDAVLSGVVAKLNCPLRVEGGRLVTDTKRGKGTAFCELSMGARYGIVIPLAIAAVGRGNAFTLKQEAFEGLDFANRTMIAGLLEDSGVTMFTAECDRDRPTSELRAELFEPQA